MNNQKSKDLIQKYLSGQCTSDEEAIIESWYVELAGKKRQDKVAELDDLSTKQEMFRTIQSKKNTFKKKSKSLWPHFAIAASILLCLSVGIYFLLRGTAGQRFVSTKIHDIAPGTSKAILHLANGKTIVLADAENGVLSRSNNTAISKNGVGKVIYRQSSKLILSKVKLLYDTLTTPRGGVWNIKLADGSIVWLNASTSIRFPESFANKERSVELINGEAYFEVTHDANRPFKVRVSGQVIEDLGTHFNINAYQDEDNIKTTLLEGRIKLSKGNKSAILKPGEEAISINDRIVVGKADLDQSIAWKNGYFQFNYETLESILRKVSRWYDVDLQYVSNSIRTIKFSGSISKYKNVSQILKKLELTGTVNFKIEKNKIIAY